MSRPLSRTLRYTPSPADTDTAASVKQLCSAMKPLLEEVVGEDPQVRKEERSPFVSCLARQSVQGVDWSTLFTTGREKARAVPVPKPCSSRNVALICMLRLDAGFPSFSYWHFMSSSFLLEHVIEHAVQIGASPSASRAA